MKRYVWKNGQFVDPKTHEPMPKPYQGRICAPMVVSDIEEFRSPITGQLISSRSTKREDMKRHGCVEWEPINNRPRGFKNERFAKKHGLKLNPELVSK